MKFYKKASLCEFGVVVLAFLVSCLTVSADVKGVDGVINFDRSSNGQIDMKLDSMGLSLSSAAATANLDVSGNAIISNSLNIGGGSSNSNLHVGGTIGFGFQTISDNNTFSQVTQSHVFLDTSGGNITFELARPSLHEGQLFDLKKSSSLNELFISGGPIDASSYLHFQAGSSPLPSLSLLSSGGNWHILSVQGQSTYDDNLVGYWSLDEVSGGIAYDRSLSENHGSLQGSLSLPANSVDGPVVNSMEFSGTNEYIEIGNPSELNFGTADFSISFWLYRDTNPTGNLRAMSKGGTNDTAAEAGFCFFVSDTTVAFAVNPNGVRTIINGTHNGVDQWTHVVGVVDRSGNMKIYIDGVEDGSAAAPGGSVTGTKTFRIGTTSNPNLYWDGKLDDIRIYNKALGVS